MGKKITFSDLESIGFMRSFDFEDDFMVCHYEKNGAILEIHGDCDRIILYDVTSKEITDLLELENYI